MPGTIPPGGEAVFLWAFQPLEPRAYAAALPLLLGPGAAYPAADNAVRAAGEEAAAAGCLAAELVLEGRGYHPHDAEALGARGGGDGGSERCGAGPM